MRALVFDQSLSYRPHHPNPPLPSDSSEAKSSVLVRVRQAGICATDLEIAKGYMQYRGVLGHEFVGEVVEAPDGALIGQRVVGEINVPCGHCDLCEGGLSNHCRSRTVLGIVNHSGAFADFLRLPMRNIHPLPASIDDDAAVFVEPLAAAFQVLRQVTVDERTWVTVLGDGRLGLLVAQVLRNAGCPVRLLGKHPAKLALCEKWEIRARPVDDVKLRQDQDCVVDCTGSADGLELALQLVRPRGTIVLKTTAAVGKPLNLWPVVVNEITVIGSRCGPFIPAITALAEKQIDVASLIHRRMKLEQGVEAMQLAAQSGVLKVLLLMQ